MLSKCANPECSAKFRYLHDGKVFRVDFEEHPHLRHTQETGLPVKTGGPKLLSNLGSRPDEAQRAPEYFWLCSACSEHLTLAAKEGSVMLLPLPTPAVRRAAAS